MRVERLTDSNTELFAQAFKLYEAAFPTEERRDKTETLRVLQKDEYHFCVLTEEGELIGIMLFWVINKTVFLEHFAILPELRGKGYGSAALEKLKEMGMTVILEMEPPEDEYQKRRYEFYKRNGFVMTPYHHIQAKYHIGDEDLVLKILSYPNVVSREDYFAFYSFLSREIGIAPVVSDDVTVRPMLPEDDAAQVAGLIYLTDPYIYPYWFDNSEQAVKVISEMIDLPTLYNRRNITVAVTADNKIAGMVVSTDSPFFEEKEYIYHAFDLAGVSRDERTDFIFQSYYAKMGGERNIHYIANVAVHKNHRKKGIAAAMIKYVLRNNPRAFLECVQSNTGTWRLYQRLGFKIQCEYPGVFDIPCFKMIYGKEKD